MSWLESDSDDDYMLDESAVRVRPDPKANRPRTKKRPRHDDALRGYVLGVDRGRYTVLLDEGTATEREVTSTRARELRKGSLVVGDRVHVVGDTSAAPGTLARIIRVEPRDTVLRRSADDSDQVERVVVANADQLLIVVAAADPPPRPRLVDRYLVAALDAGIHPILVVTKTDLADPSNFLHVFAHLNLTILTSGKEYPPLSELEPLLVNHRTVFVGHSGVGKSTLVNALIPHAQRATGHVNDVTGRGRHTSSSTVSLKYCSQTGCGWVIDTPGVRSFGLGHVDPAHILRAFPELSEYAAECPRQCTHSTRAPECALDRAAQDGSLDSVSIARLDSMHRLMDNLGSPTP